jgi:hypothetical protein
VGFGDHRVSNASKAGTGRLQFWCVRGPMNADAY